MSKALYRKYRSKSLSEVIGQKHITDILGKAISQGRVSHAYLLTGPRGVGKTSVARILAHEINKLEYNEENTHIDIIEIDAASNNGVEDVRDLREKVQIAPFSASKKIYIIDEVHMLSKPAFNALLKTIEEPPEHVVFILATTNIEKIPATIISRAQRFSFRPIEVSDAVNHLSFIAKKEGISITGEAISLIAERSDGSFRDSISLLDQLSNLTDGKTKQVTIELIENLLGLAPTSMIDQMLSAVEKRDIKKIVDLVDRSIDEGVDVNLLVTQLTNRIRKNIYEKPELLTLLDSLIDVTKSPQPQLKLLSVLGLAAYPKNAPKTAALLTPALEVSATIAELERHALKDKPKSIIKKSKTSNKLNVSKFDWSKLLDYVKKNHIALHSVLSKCNHDLNDDNLTLYTNSTFYKKKLDDIKYSSLLSKCLQEIGVYELNIHTVPTTIPPKDSQAAAVAAIMGGGEEVSIESV